MNPFRNPAFPESETLSLSDVKTQLLITNSDIDDRLRLFIPAIREESEKYLQRTLVSTTWEYRLDAFCDEIELQYGPVQSITSIQYVDTDGATQTLAASGYQFTRKGKLKPSYDNTWPSTRDQYDAVTITYLCGETHAGNVPMDIKLAMQLWIGACDLSSENDVIGTIISPIPNNAENILNLSKRWPI
ncbi:MAG: hypothetical protein GY904_18005 [Planctomycetaceae bacterium]|nr:hypothetical protein [Planctomycetaceae bacterium]